MSCQQQLRSPHLKRRKQAVPKRDTSPAESLPVVEATSGTGGASGKRMSNSLIALGSAAIVAVYAAGYQRTRAAAQSFSDEDARRRPPAHAAPTPSAAVPELASAASAHPAPAPAPPAQHVAAAPLVAPIAKSGDHVANPASSAGNTTAPPANPVASVAKAPVPTGKAGPPSATKSDIVSQPGSLSKASVPVDSAPASSGVPSVVAPVDTPRSAGVPDSSQATDSVATAPRLRDGTYTGWGTSRHGDIQAAVVIEGGRILRASIVQCLTRYSCSWIAALPPQVVSRQSPEVDYVSGATQSTNAFYYAIVEALSKAR